MKFTAFNATCPFEIGDKIKTRKLVREDMAARAHLSPATVIEEEHTITDIVCMNYVRSGENRIPLRTGRQRETGAPRNAAATGGTGTAGGGTGERKEGLRSR